MKHQRLKTWFGLGLVLFAWMGCVNAAERNLTRTNWTERWITNRIEVRMPTNVFVNVFQTNWAKEFITNVVDVYATNVVTQTVTNTIPIEETRTVEKTAYKTNWNTVTVTNQLLVDGFRTNIVDRWHTNWKTSTVVRELAAEAVRTNVVDQWRTNWKTLTLTNWQTVLVMKTNWVNQPVTNVVEIDLASNQANTTQHSDPTPAAQSANNETSSTPGAVTAPDELSVEAFRTSRPSANNLVEVQMRARWRGDPDNPPRIQQWRVESENGAILCSAQDQEFKRELPAGRYKVEVKAQHGNNSLLAARGTLALSAAEAVIVSKLSARR